MSAALLLVVTIAVMTGAALQRLSGTGLAPSSPVDHLRHVPGETPCT